MLYVSFPSHCLEEVVKTVSLMLVISRNLGRCPALGRLIPKGYLEKSGSWFRIVHQSAIVLSLMSLSSPALLENILVFSLNYTCVKVSKGCTVIQLKMQVVQMTDSWPERLICRVKCTSAWLIWTEWTESQHEEQSASIIQTICDVIVLKNHTEHQNMTATDKFISTLWSLRLCMVLLE